MPKTIEKKSESIPLELPESGWDVLGHKANIDYCIEQIREHSDNSSVPVVGYELLDFGRQTYHHLYSQEEAKEIQKEDSDFKYVTLDELLKRKENIKNGIYNINESGHIKGFSHWYMRELGYSV